MNCEKLEKITLCAREALGLIKTNRIRSNVSGKIVKPKLQVQCIENNGRSRRSELATKLSLTTPFSRPRGMNQNNDAKLPRGSAGTAG